MSHGIRPPGKWNEAFVNKITFTWLEALKFVKICTDLKASMVYWGSFMNHLYLLWCKMKCHYGVPMSLQIYHKKCKIQIEFRGLNLNA